MGSLVAHNKPNPQSTRSCSVGSQKWNFSTMILLSRCSMSQNNCPEIINLQTNGKTKLGTTPLWCDAIHFFIVFISWLNNICHIPPWLQTLAQFFMPIQFFIHSSIQDIEGKNYYFHLAGLWSYCNTFQHWNHKSCIFLSPLHTCTAHREIRHDSKQIDMHIQ